MKWYWAILTYLIGLALGITLIIFAYKALKDEDMQKQLNKAIENTLKDKENEKI